MQVGPWASRATSHNCRHTGASDDSGDSRSPTRHTRPPTPSAGGTHLSKQRAARPALKQLVHSRFPCTSKCLTKRRDNALLWRVKLAQNPNSSLPE